MHFNFLFLVLLLETQFCNQEEINVQMGTDASQLSDYICQLTTIINIRKLAIWHKRNDNDFVLEILKMVKVPVILNARELKKANGVGNRMAYSSVVLIFDNLNVEKILNDTLWNNHTRFLKFAKTLKEIQTDFQKFWKIKIVNVFEMLLRDKEVIIYSFLPYQKPDCGLGEPVIVDRFVFSTGKCTICIFRVFLKM